VQNHRRGFVRAWHGHRREGKYVLAVKGAALVCGVQIDDWDRPSTGLAVQRHVLSEKTPAVLYLPPGYANGFMSLTDDAKLMFLSTATLQESLADDVRFDARYWDPWSIEER
jgi:dTDP-4-dehydrorhamnose 3,5-epimerase